MHALFLQFDLPSIDKLKRLTGIYLARCTFLWDRVGQGMLTHLPVTSIERYTFVKN